MEPGNRQHYRGEAQRSRDDFALVTETEVSPHTVTAPRRSIPQCVSSKVPVKLSSLEGLVSSCGQRGRTGLDRWQLSFVSLCLVTVLLRPMFSVGLAAIFSSAGSSDIGCVEVFKSQTSLPTATHEVERTNKTPHIGAKFPVSSAAATLNGFLSRSNGQCNTACTLGVGLFPNDDGREQSDDTLSY